MTTSEMTRWKIDVLVGAPDPFEESGGAGPIVDDCCTVSVEGVDSPDEAPSGAESLFAFDVTYATSLR